MPERRLPDIRPGPGEPGLPGRRAVPPGLAAVPDDGPEARGRAAAAGKNLLWILAAVAAGLGLGFVPDLLFHRKPEGIITGTVVAAEDGRPLSGIIARPSADGTFYQQALTNSSGGFRLEAVPQDREVLVTIVDVAEKFVGEKVVLRLRGSRIADIGKIRLLAGSWCDQRRRGLSAGRIGLTPIVRNGAMVATAIVPNSPASRQGVVEGDEIVAVDGRPVSGLGQANVHYLLRGPPGAKVTLLLRTGAAAPRSVTLVRVKGLSSADEVAVGA
jgi:membrane-associated protease RseP (regulator of RpoE activity)